MILAMYVIGSAIALIVLTIRLRDTYGQLRRMRRERGTHARTIETSLLAPAAGGLTATPAAGGPALPDPVHSERW